LMVTGVDCDLELADLLRLHSDSTSRPWASVVSVPSGPLLNNHTG
jgi:hypothetical protein